MAYHQWSVEHQVLTARYLLQQLQKNKIMFSEQNYTHTQTASQFLCIVLPTCQVFQQTYEKEVPKGKNFLLENCGNECHFLVHFCIPIPSNYFMIFKLWRSQLYIAKATWISFSFSWYREVCYTWVIMDHLQNTSPKNFFNKRILFTSFTFSLHRSSVLITFWQDRIFKRFYRTRIQ